MKISSSTPNGSTAASQNNSSDSLGDASPSAQNNATNSDSASPNAQITNEAAFRQAAKSSSFGGSQGSTFEPPEEAFDALVDTQSTEYALGRDENEKTLTTEDNNTFGAPVELKKNDAELETLDSGENRTVSVSSASSTARNNQDEIQLLNSMDPIRQRIITEDDVDATLDFGEGAFIKFADNVVIQSQARFENPLFSTRIWGYGNNGTYTGSVNTEVYNLLGNDISINSAGGDDTISVSGDRQLLHGGEGGDVIYSNHGEDVEVRGGPGDDVISTVNISGNKGVIFDRSLIVGGEGDDLIWITDSTDVWANGDYYDGPEGEPGNNKFYVENSHDIRVNGGDSDDKATIDGLSTGVLYDAGKGTDKLFIDLPFNPDTYTHSHETRGGSPLRSLISADGVAPAIEIESVEYIEFSNGYALVPRPSTGVFDLENGVFIPTEYDIIMVEGG